MSWQSISFEVGAPEVEALTEALLEAGALAVDVEDAAAGTDAEDPLFAEGDGAVGPWRHSRVRALVAADVNVAAWMEGACARAGIAVARWQVEAVADRDWVRATQAQFQPLPISPRLWIVPTWHAAPDPAAVNIVLDPGLAFGTGNHPTTRLCLQWLERKVTAGVTVLDYGCGSGILAVAAMKLGAARAVAIDIDPQALLAARGNAIQNQVEIEVRSAADPAGRAADIVVANILSGPLIVLAPLLAGLTAPRGRLALSGILAPQAAEVCAAYGPWFDIEEDGAEDNWVLLAGIRK